MTAFFYFIDKALQWLVAFVLLGMAALSATDVFLRTVLGKPIPAAFEITETLLAILVFAGIALAALRSSNITLDLIDAVLSSARLVWVTRGSATICALAFGGASWLMAIRALRLGREASVSVGLGIPYAPFTWFVTGMLGLTALIFLAQAVVPHLNLEADRD